jgi:hypothetical protein
MAADFFVVPTTTYRVLFVLVILAHARRPVVRVAVTDRPDLRVDGAATPKHLSREACPSYLPHDRDSAFAAVARTIAAIQIHDVVTARESPWRNAYVERVIDSIRRECLPRDRALLTV